MSASPRSRGDSIGAVVIGTSQTYAVALLAAAGLLWFFGGFDGESAAMMCAQVVVLGFATKLGASGGRLLLEPA